MFRMSRTAASKARRSMTVVAWLRCAGCLVVSLPWLALADPLLDFGMVDVAPGAQRVQSAPVVSWQVQANAEHFCAAVQPKDGFASRREGCVYWQRNPARCTIVTTASTTHSQLGHLFWHCLKGQ